MMTLDEFIAEETDVMARFQRWWKARNASDPAAFPAEMLPGEWEEHLHFFDPAQAEGETT